MLHVLYIEDQPDIQTILRLSLTATQQFKVDVASTGADGLREAEALRPDLILLDYSLPDMDGPDVLARLRQSPATARIPVIFVTAMTQAVEMEKCRAAGALGVITKPFLPREIGAQVRALMANAPPPAPPS